jgi:hypothetical protein
LDGQFGRRYRQGAVDARQYAPTTRRKARLVSQTGALRDRRVIAVILQRYAPIAVPRSWPFFELQNNTRAEAKSTLDAAEYTVFQLALKNSTFGAVLNEADIAPASSIALPQSYRQRIIPDELFAQRKHPDTRIARRATTIANLARVISEREVSRGLRRTLTTQARRLERLATDRFNELAGTPTPPDEIGPEG